MDGRPLPKNPDPTWMGYSVGHWEGDTLVVETIGLNDRAWLDVFGHPRSENVGNRLAKLEAAWTGGPELVLN
jgi:hypothetical protein